MYQGYSIQKGLYQPNGKGKTKSTEPSSQGDAASSILDVISKPISNVYIPLVSTYKGHVITYKGHLLETSQICGVIKGLQTSPC